MLMVLSTKLILKRYVLILFVLSLITLVLSACGGKGPLPPADKTSPTVISVIPANGAQNIPINSSVIITFSEAMDASTINGQTIILSAGNSNVQGVVTYSGVTAIFKPTSNLNPKTIYTVAVEAGVKDAAGNAMSSPYGYIFITGIDAQQDITPPRVVDVQPSNRTTGVSPNTVIVVMFSEPMDPTTITNTTIQISSLGQVFASTVTPFGSAAIIKPTSGLATSTDYTVLVTTRVKDLAGNAMTDAFVSSFRTGTGPDTNAPSVVAGSIIPASGSATVSVNTPISVTFSKPMNVSTINLSTFIVSDGTSTIPGDIQYYGATVVFTPGPPLLSSTA
jgi:predicted small lipoprotein YifL